MVMDGNQSRGADRFGMHTNIKLQCCAPEANRLYSNFSVIKKEKRTLAKSLS